MSKDSKDSVIADSPFSEEVIERDYAEGIKRPDSFDKKEPDNDTSESKQEQGKKKAPILSDNFEVEEDDDYERLKELENKAKEDYDNVPEMDFIEADEESDAEVVGSKLIHDEMMDAGKITLSEQIYTNLSIVVPEALHELTKVKERKFTRNGWNDQVVETTLEEVRKHNKRQKQKFLWGEIHQTNIQKPLRSLLREKGLENAMSPAGQLLMGVCVVALVTFLTFREVKRENRSMEDRLLDKINAIVNPPRPATPPRPAATSNGEEKKEA